VISVEQPASQGNGLRVEVRQQSEDIGEIKASIREISATLTAMSRDFAVRFAELKSEYATLMALDKLVDRVSTLEAARNRQLGGWQWLVVGLGYTLTAVTLLLAAKGKLW